MDRFLIKRKRPLFFFPFFDLNYYSELFKPIEISTIDCQSLVIPINIKIVIIYQLLILKEEHIFRANYKLYNYN